MKNARPAETEASALEPRSNSTKFEGTDNPRWLRVVWALLTRSRTRQDIDEIAGAANGPQIIADLRKLGLDAPCQRIDAIDRDGQPCRPGVYYFTDKDATKIRYWLNHRQSGYANVELMFSVAAASVSVIGAIVFWWLS